MKVVYFPSVCHIFQISLGRQGHSLLNSELSLCETDNFRKLSEHDLEHREKYLFPSLLPAVKRALEQSK